jgi:hypothetical protein
MQSDIIADRYRQILKEQYSNMGPQGYGGVSVGGAKKSGAKKSKRKCVKKEVHPSGKVRCSKYSKGGVAIGEGKGKGKGKGSKKQKRAAENNKWIIHVKDYRAAHPGMSYKDALSNARSSYHP